MEIIYALLIGVMFGTSVYFFLRRSIVKLILGILFMSNSVNLLLFISSGLDYNIPPFSRLEASSRMADPLPHALILTSIVIGFGIIAFSLVLNMKYHQATGTEDMDEATQEIEQ